MKLLTFHVASGILLAKDISDGLEITTLEGKKLKAKVSGGNVTISGASVTTTDIQRLNGVVHIIDKVLIPEGLALAATNIESPDGDGDGGGSSAGAIAGIVIGVFAAVLGAGLFAMMKLRGKKVDRNNQKDFKAEEYQELNAQISQNPHC